MIDIGLNLTSSQFSNDIEQVLKNALLANVTQMIVTGTSIEKSQQALVLCQQYPDVLSATAGIHPHDASSMTEQSISQLTTLLADKKVVAVGECGLDFNRNFSTPAEQLSCFERQLELAVELQMPVFLHQRDAQSDFMRLINKYRTGLVGGVAHCFTGGRAELEAYLDADLSVGITGWLCDERRGSELRDCVHLIPKDKVMVETDAPYLFPRDYVFPDDANLNSKQKKKRRSRNEPQYLAHIVNTLAGLMDLDYDKLVKLTSANSKRFFQL
ncbi:TatD family hydrolase [sulfur-oxidizing endosymbiont of Gigantopelta aegis]|uniref:TatD family hydrolase n=1 Tax=sulfur-oxidizing endosymbiont of Gigantopelta aegis TaxID=2794934 RepID=UPI0018DC0312|nr:TatD family hydrolase [sulfur-oxidizing endosymbiont of Gigantopelta aegis]